MLPSFDDPYLKIAIRRLNLPETPLLVPIIQQAGSQNGFCSENVYRKIRADGGELVQGWQFYHAPYWLEGEFHAIWKSPGGALIDITPNELHLDKNLFVPDLNRTFDGTYRDNLRINSTSNPLVDGLILVEEAIFKLQDQFFDAKGVRLAVIPEKVAWKAKMLSDISEILTEMVVIDQTETSPCFCGSEVPYNLHCGANLKSHLDALLTK